MGFTLRMRISVLLLFLCGSVFGQNNNGVGTVNDRTYYRGTLAADRVLQAPKDTIKTTLAINTGNIAVKGGLFWYFDGATWVTPAGGGGVTLSQLNDSLVRVYDSVAALRADIVPVATSTIAIGDTVIDGLNNSVLFIDGNKHLANDEHFGFESDVLYAPEIQARHVGTGSIALRPSQSQIQWVNSTATTLYNLYFPNSDADIYFPLSEQPDSLALKARTTAEISDTSAVLRGLIPSVSGYALQEGLDDTAAAIRSAIPSVTGFATTAALADSVSGRMKYTDTSALSNRINLKVNYSDSGTVYYSKYGVDTGKAAIRASGYLTLADSNVVSTKAYRQKAVDSLNAVIATKGTMTSVTFTGVGIAFTPSVVTTVATVNASTVQNVVTATTVTATYTVVSTDTRPMTVIVTSLNAATTFANPTGTFGNLQALYFALSDNGTPQTLSWGSNFTFGTTAGLTALPSTTVANLILLVQFNKNPQSNKWMMTGLVRGFAR